MIAQVGMVMTLSPDSLTPKETAAPTDSCIMLQLNMYNCPQLGCRQIRLVVV